MSALFFLNLPFGSFEKEIAALLDDLGYQRLDETLMFDGNFPPLRGAREALAGIAAAIAANRAVGALSALSFSHDADSIFLLAL